MWSTDYHRGMNQKLLNALNITNGEAKIYKAALKARKATPAMLGKMTGIKRTTAYHVARMLVDKGLLLEDSTKRPRVFLPATPEDVQTIIKDEQAKFNVREKLLRELAGELSRTTVKELYPVPQVRFVEEEKLEKFFYNEVAKWHKSTIERDSTWWGFQDHTFVEHYSKVVDWYWKKSGKEFSVKLLSNQSDIEKKIVGKYPKRAVKFWNKANNFLSTTWIAGDYVIMVNTRQHPFYLVEIHDATLANDMREVFKNLWLLV